MKVDRALKSIGVIGCFCTMRLTWFEQLRRESLAEHFSQSQHCSKLSLRQTSPRCSHNLYSGRVHASVAERQNKSYGPAALLRTVAESARSVVPANANISTPAVSRARPVRPAVCRPRPGSWRRSSRCCCCCCCNGSAKQYCSVTAA